MVVRVFVLLHLVAGGERLLAHVYAARRVVLDPEVHKRSHESGTHHFSHLIEMMRLIRSSGPSFTTSCSFVLSKYHASPGAIATCSFSTRLMHCGFDWRTAY